MLTRLYAHNYRCLLNFELRPGAAGLILGYNGVGKTTVFDVLGAVQDLVVHNQEAGDAFTADTVSFIGDGARRQRFELDVASPHGQLKYTLVVDHGDGEACAIVREDVTLHEAGGADVLYAFEHGEVLLAGSDAPIDVRTFPFTAQRSYLASVDRERANAKLVWFLEFVERIWILKLNPQAVPAAARKDALWLDRDGGNFASWCRHLILEARDRVEAAEATLREILPGFRSLNVQAAGRVRVLVARFQPEGVKAPVDVDFDLLSDGQRALIILYVVLHAVRGHARLMCFDEPDNFVSIREIQPFLIALTDDADDSSAQTLLISHTSEVIDFVGPRGSLLLERPDGGATRVAEIADAPGLRLSERMARGWHGAA